jgi:hypothetical protein
MGMAAQEGWGLQRRQTSGADSHLFAIFYIDNPYLASRDASFLQHALVLLVDLFQQVGLQTNTSKMQTMICTPGRIWTQLLTKLYCWMQCNRVTATEWNSRDVQCYQYGKGMKAGYLGRHLAEVQDIYQQTVVTKDCWKTDPPQHSQPMQDCTAESCHAPSQDVRVSYGTVG